MKFDLPGDSSRRHAIRWLKQLIRYVGHGFHLDTTPNDYTSPEGRPLFSPSDCVVLERSLDRLLKILGSEEPCEIGADVTAIYKRKISRRSLSTKRALSCVTRSNGNSRFTSLRPPPNISLKEIACR